MVSYKQPISPGTSVTDGIYTYCHVIDIDLTNKVAHVIDQLGIPRAISLTRSIGKQIEYPKVGEDWIISRQYGDWIFIVAINVQATLPTIPTILYPGSVIAFAGNVAPSGWLIADGSAVSRTTYASLFAAIGVIHGSGDGSTTFNLPNLVGKFIEGAGASNALAATGGSATHLHTITGTTAGHTHSTPAHSHPLSSAGAAEIYLSATGFVAQARITLPGGASFTETVRMSGTNAATGTGSLGTPLTGNTDSGGASTTGSASDSVTGNSDSQSNIPPYVNLNYIIKI